MTVTHATFTLERTYDATPERVFAACSDPALKVQWFGDPTSEMAYDLDFRVGGREHAAGSHDGDEFTYDAVIQDIVPNERIVTTYEMTMGGNRISVSLASLEIEPDDAGGTRLVLTEAGAYLDGFDKPEVREQGTRELLDALGTFLARD